MSNRTLLVLCIAGLVGVAVLLALHIMPIFWTGQQGKYLAYNDVRGSAIEHKGKLYTLNFDQQTKLITLLNQAVPVGKEYIEKKQEDLNIQRIVIYRFNAPDIILTPYGYVDEHLIFMAPAWNANGLLKDTSHGALKDLISTTYDP